MTSFFTLLKTGTLTSLVLFAAAGVFAGAAIAGGDCHGPACQSRPLSVHSRTQVYVPVYRHVPAYEDYAVRYGRHYTPDVICSTALGCELRIEPVRLSNWGTFTCARLISSPSANSCLAGLGLVEGDLITRLDGVRVTRPEQLDCGPGEVACRYICLRDRIVREATIAITAGTSEIAPPPVALTPPPARVDVAPAPPVSPDVPADTTVTIAPVAPVEVAPAPASVVAP